MPKPVVFGFTSRLFYFLSGAPKRMLELSMRESAGKRQWRPVICAVGGNSIEGLEKPTAKNIFYLFAESGRKFVVTHGNGPQVGKKLAEAEAAGISKSIAACTAETQTEIGETLKISIERELWGRHDSPIYTPITVIPTRVIVKPEDPAFNNPTKYIGKDFSEAEIGKGLAARADGLFDWQRGNASWIMKRVPDKPGMVRRVVPSPKPIDIHPEDLAAIKKAVFIGKLVIAAGGGGIPVFPDGNPAEAVIDKDLATALLCHKVTARRLIISTGVDHVSHFFNTPEQKDIRYYQLAHARRHLLKGQYPEGKMGEKIEAAINALRSGVNSVLITHPEASWIDFEGTFMTRGIDLGGRLYNLARMAGLYPNELQRWLVV